MKDLVIKHTGYTLSYEVTFKQAVWVAYELTTVTIDSVEKVTHIDFFYQLPDDREKMIESKIDLNQWNW